MSAPAVAAASEERILLVRLSALGDILQTLPALAALRAARPGAQIGWLVEDRHAGVLADHPHLDRLFVFERKRAQSGLGGALAAIGTMRRAVRAWGPDVVVDLQGNAKAAWLGRICGAPRRIGLAAADSREGSHLVATETVEAGPPREHRADRARRLLRVVGADVDARPVLAQVPDTARARMREALGESAGGFALLLPGTSDFGAFKRWPAQGFARLAERLGAERGLPSLVAFGPGQRPLAEAVVAASEGAAALAPETRDLLELRALIESAALAVGPDSGPLGLASLADVPTVVLFGPKDPQVYAPLGGRTHVVWKQVYCSPCKLRRCGDPICMTTLTVDEVWPAVDAALRDGTTLGENGTS